MRSETRRRLDRLVWQRRVSIGSVIALSTVLFGALYLYINWTDPVLERRIISGTVTNWMREQTDLGAGALGVWVTLNDGRDVMIRQAPPGIPRHGPAEIEERHHKSGRKSYLWLKSKSD
jgi:hypothetical protein